MHGPEAAQQLQRGIRQGHKTILIALGVADMDTVACGIDISNLQTQAFAKTQAKAVDRKVEYPIAQLLRCTKQPSRLGNGDNVRQSYSPWRLDQIDMNPGLVQYVPVEESKSIQIQLDGTPGVALLEIGEIIDQLLLGQIVDAMVKILADATDAPGVGVDSFGLQPLELQVPQMFAIILVES